MQKPTANLETIAERIHASFAAKDAAREKALRLSREVIRHCAHSIRAIHRREFDQTRELLDAARALVRDIDETLANHPDLRYSGFVHNCQKEYAEGCATLALVRGELLPEPEELGVQYPAYLAGLSEAVGELRRHLLDSIRKGDLSHCEDVITCMDDVYDVMVTMDFPDALTFSLRRVTDVTRGILEKTRGDLTLAIMHCELEQKLETRSAEEEGEPSAEDGQYRE